MIDVGVQVVCIAEHWPKNLKNHKQMIFPSKGQILTVREVHKDLCNNTDDIGLTFEEIVNPVLVWSHNVKIEPSFHIQHFRPVKKTDISIFTEMLNKTPEKV